MLFRPFGQFDVGIIERRGSTICLGLDDRQHLGEGLRVHTWRFWITSVEGFPQLKSGQAGGARTRDPVDVAGRSPNTGGAMAIRTFVDGEPRIGSAPVSGSTHRTNRVVPSLTAFSRTALSG